MSHIINKFVFDLVKKVCLYSGNTVLFHSASNR